LGAPTVSRATLTIIVATVGRASLGRISGPLLERSGTSLRMVHSVQREAA
jgi:hypothetical protein